MRESRRAQRPRGGRKHASAIALIGRSESTTHAANERASGSGDRSHRSRGAAGLLQRAIPQSGDIRAILSNAGSLVGSIALQSLLGFPYWWIAARTFPAAAVGFAAATISAMTLLGTVGMLGMGTFLTGELHRQVRDRESLVATALTFAACAGFIIGLIFAIGAPGLLGLHALSGHIGPILLFAAGVGLTSTTNVVDQAVIGLLRGGLQLRRNLVFAVFKLAALAAVGFAGLSAGGPAIYATWVFGLAFSMVWLVALARRQGSHIRLFRPRWSMFRRRRRAALEHHFLNLVLQAPALTTPLVVTATISVTASAYYYSASLISGFLSYGAFALTFALYAVAVRDVNRLRPALQTTLRLSFGLILAANVVLWLGAPLILRAFGREYASQGTIVLRISGIYVLLLIIKDHFIAIARVRGRIVKAARLCAVGAVLELSLAAVGGAYGGLAWVAVGSFSGLLLEASVMAPTVIRELRRTPRRASPASEPGTLIAGG
jgi:O-antigen/teichoic acid export membrane protein